MNALKKGFASQKYKETLWFIRSSGRIHFLGLEERSGNGDERLTISYSEYDWTIKMKGAKHNKSTTKRAPKNVRVESSGGQRKTGEGGTGSGILQTVTEHEGNRRG